jgi:D-glycero-alpha-D-manno-heptose-7-phosphate kinase
MIITRSPLRISLGGGGTDLPSYYEEHSGFLIAAAIDKYVYITLHQTFVDELIVKYSKLERVKSADQVEHPIIREAMKMVGLDGPYLEITSMADIPAGTGLGSSGSFTTALLKALHAVKKHLVHPADLAEQACDIEINRLGEPIGKQDQYIAAYGGITCFKFMPDGRVDAWPLKITEETLFNLEDNLLLYGLLALSLLDLAGAATKEPGGRQGDDRKPALRQGPGQAESAGFGSRRPARVCASDGRALATEKRTFRQHVQPAHQRLV